MKTTTAQRFGSLGKSFQSPSAAAAVFGAALLASGTTDDAETAWSPSAACLLPDVLPISGTLLSYGGNRQLTAGGTVTHSGALNLGANALTVGTITASGTVTTTALRDGGLGDHYLSAIIRDLSYNYFSLTANGLNLGNTAGLRFFGALNVLGTPDATLTRNAAGVLQVGTTAANASGSLLLTNLTASGVVQTTLDYTGTPTIKAGTGGAGIDGGSGVLRLWAQNTLFAYSDSSTTVFLKPITTSSSIQETPTQSALDPTTTNIPSGKRQGWYNSTLSEFRDWVNIGGTLLKSAAYT